MYYVHFREIFAQQNAPTNRDWELTAECIFEATNDAEAKEIFQSLGFDSETYTLADENGFVII